MHQDPASRTVQPAQELRPQANALRRVDDQQGKLRLPAAPLAEAADAEQLPAAVHAATRRPRMS